MHVSFTGMKKRLKFYSNTLKLKAYRCISPWMLSLHKIANKCVNVLISHGFIGFLVKLFIRVPFSWWRTSGKEHKVEKMESSYRVTSV